MDSLVMRVRADVHRRDQRQQEDWRPDSWRAPVLIASASAEVTDAVASPAADTPTPDSDREVENQIPPPETCSEQSDEPEANREQADEANESPPTEDVSEVGVSLSMRWIGSWRKSGRDVQRYHRRRFGRSWHSRGEKHGRASCSEGWKCTRELAHGRGELCVGRGSRQGGGICVRVSTQGSTAAVTWCTQAQSDGVEVSTFESQLCRVRTRVAPQWSAEQKRPNVYSKATTLPEWRTSLRPRLRKELRENRPFSKALSRRDSQQWGVLRKSLRRTLTIALSRVVPPNRLRQSLGRPR